MTVKHARARSGVVVTTIYLVRHGRTALNAAGVLRGRLDEPLDAVGLVEAQRLGFLFAKTPLKAVVSSPLSRALDTAQAIARTHGLPVTTDDGWLDRDYGPWAGQPRSKVDQAYGSLDAAPEDEVESSQALLLRTLSALRRLLADTLGARAVVVAHDAVNRALIQHLAGVATDKQPTGCWNRLTFTGDRCVCDLVGARPEEGNKP
jgi:broad specificity phosphatase PhoE